MSPAESSACTGQVNAARNTPFAGNVLVSNDSSGQIPEPPHPAPLAPSRFFGPSGAGSATKLTDRMTRINSKRNYAVLGDKSFVNKPRGPKKAKKEMAPSSSLTTLSVAVHGKRPLPIVVGTQYMRIDVIDLTEVEVSNMFNCL